MRSRVSRHSIGSFASSPRFRGTRFVSPRTSSLLVGAFVAAGALLIAPQTPRAFAAPTVGGDENGPKVKILSPAYQDVLKGRARILVGVKATQFNPSTIQLFLDDQPASKVLPLSSLASSAFDWDTRLTSDGPHRLSVRVTDTQGFRGWAEVNIYINNQNVRDNVAPDLSWGNVQSFQQVSGQMQVQLQAKDNFGVKWIIVSLNPVSKATQQPAQRSWLLSKPPYTLDFDTTKVTDGLYALSARAWDSMEQEGQSPTLTIGVVNSPVNATTIGESLVGLKEMARAQEKANPTRKTQAPLKASVNAPAKTGSNDSRSSGKAGGSTAKIPDGYTLIVPKGRTPVTGSGQSAKGGVSVPALTPPVEIAQADGITPDSDSTFGALSSPTTSNDVLAPALSGDRSTDIGKDADSVRIARVEKPKIAPRRESSSATLSSRGANTSDAPAPALSPSTVAPPQERVEIARLSLPESSPRELDVAPVLSAAKTSLGGTISSAHNVRIAITSVPKLVVSAPGTKTSAHRTATVSNVRLRPPHAAAHHRGETSIAPMTVPQLSAHQPANDGVVTAKSNGASPSLNGSRIAARPKTGALDASPIEVVPDTANMIRPAITVSPVQVAFNTKLPESYLARHKTTLHAIATHFRLPVELVAAANGLTSDTHILPGTKILLPRQVQLSYNGQKVRGDVASLMAGDTTFTAMRFLFEHTGGTIKWDAAKHEVIAHKGASTVRVKIGSNVASVNNKQVMMQLAAFLFEGRTMVPARFFEEGLNAQVEWNPQTGHLVVAMAG